MRPASIGVVTLLVSSITLHAHMVHHVMYGNNRKCTDDKPQNQRF